MSQTPIFYLNYMNSNIKVVFTSHFYHFIQIWDFWSFGGVFPLDFHQLILGDSVDYFQRRLDQVGVNPELFNCILSFSDSDHVFLFFWASRV